VTTFATLQLLRCHNVVLFNDGESEIGNRLHNTMTVVEIRPAAPSSETITSLVKDRISHEPEILAREIASLRLRNAILMRASNIFLALRVIQAG
jgi:hypothetical protein